MHIFFPYIVNNIHIRKVSQTVVMENTMYISSKIIRWENGDRIGNRNLPMYHIRFFSYKYFHTCIQGAENVVIENIIY